MFDEDESENGCFSLSSEKAHLSLMERASAYYCSNNNKTTKTNSGLQREYS